MAAIDEMSGGSGVARLHRPPEAKWGGGVSGDAAKWRRKIPTGTATTHDGPTNAPTARLLRRGHTHRKNFQPVSHVLYKLRDANATAVLRFYRF